MLNSFKIGNTMAACPYCHKKFKCVKQLTLHIIDILVIVKTPQIYCGLIYKEQLLSRVLEKG